MTLTLKSCIKSAEELGVEIAGDINYRGECNKEDGELATLHQKISFNFPEYADLAFHVPNEFTADKSMGNAKFSHIAKRKSKGVKNGMCDYVVLPIRIGAPPFLCEMKRRDISLSLKTAKNKLHYIEQIKLLASQSQHGAVAFVSLGSDCAYKKFVEYVEKWKGN